MKKHWSVIIPLIAGLALINVGTVISQPFESAGISFAGAGRSAIAWADYDNDHDLDVMVTGIGNDDNPVSILYRNDEGNFSDAGFDFIPVKESAVNWGDYDLDGDQDLLLCGNAATGDVTRLYRNDGNGFTELDPGLPGIQGGDILWVDIDSDADLDIFITGNWIAKIYINHNGDFTASGQTFGLYSGSAAAFGDYDNDGDLDLLISGDSGAGAVTKIFRNDDGIFTDAQAGLPGLMSGTTDWVDYDNDGDLDVAISGFNDALEAQFYLYKNEWEVFFQEYPGIEGFALGQADWGDYDLDGDPDLVMSGKATGCGAVAAGIYRNDGDGVFYKLSDEITAATRSSLGWADFDNDGDLDFIIAGLNLSDYPFTKLYLNTAGDNVFTINDQPGAPDNFTSEVLENSVTLYWSGASDEETASDGLGYNLMLGSASTGCDVISPMSLHPQGYRLVIGTGNAGQLESISIENLEPGTYYWSVQTIDQAFEGSVFSPEQSFTITATGLSDNEVKEPYKITPNPVSDQFTIENKSQRIISEVGIHDLKGNLIQKINPCSASARIVISALPAGIYFITILSDEMPARYKIVKR